MWDQDTYPSGQQKGKRRSCHGGRGVSCDHSGNYIAQQDRAKARMDYRQGGFGLQGWGRYCGQEVNEHLSAQKQQGGGFRYEERRLQAKPGGCGEESRESRADANSTKKK